MAIRALRREKPFRAIEEPYLDSVPARGAGGQRLTWWVPAAAWGSP